MSADTVSSPTTSEPAAAKMFRLDSTGASATLLLRVPVDAQFFAELATLPHLMVAGSSQAGGIVYCSLNTLFQNEEITAALAPLAAALIKRRAELKPYTKGYELSNWPSSNSAYSVYLQVPADTELIDAISNDPGTHRCKAFPDERRIFFSRYLAYPDEEYHARIETHL